MNFISTPANAVDAMRLARAEEKAKQIIAEGYSFELHPEIEVVTVNKPGIPSASYFINLSSVALLPLLPLGCSCPSFQNSGAGYCKHTLAFERLQEEEANQLKNAPTADEEYGRAWYADRAALRA